jgi:CubicO group peptidase (beta-lactamase class C family)
MPTMQLGKSLEGRIVALLETAGVPGCSLAVHCRGGQAALDLGWADLGQQRPVVPTTVFHLFSGTKLYTAAALMLLHERGQIDLDAPISDTLDGLELRHPVSIRQLASHSSGLPDTLSAFIAVHFQGTRMPTTAAALARYRTHRGKPAGCKAAYRNVNYAILGELISQVTKVPYVDFVSTELLGPLKSGAAFEYGDDERSTAALGYTHRFNPMRWLLRLLTPRVAARLEGQRLGPRIALEEYALDTAAIGGLMGCSEDFLPLVAEMLSPTDGVLTAQSKREMLTVHAEGAAGIASKVGVGLGWKLGRQGGTTFWNHEGGGLGFTSETRLYPDHGLGMVLLMNTTQTSKLSWLAHEICELLRVSLDEDSLTLRNNP